MSEDGCVFCIDAGLDFDWCRVCGRGLPEPEPEPESPVLEAVRKARGHLTGEEVCRRSLRLTCPDVRVASMETNPIEPLDHMAAEEAHGG